MIKKKTGAYELPSTRRKEVTMLPIIELCQSLTIPAVLISVLLYVWSKHRQMN